MNPGDQKPFGEFRPNACRQKISQDFAAFLDTTLAENEDVLHGNDVAFHTGDLRYVDYLARTVAVAANLHHDVDRGSYLPADSTLGNIQVSHGHHRFEAAQRIAGRVSVNCRQGTVMACVHGLEHV